MHQDCCIFSFCLSILTESKFGRTEQTHFDIILPSCSQLFNGKTIASCWVLNFEYFTAKKGLGLTSKGNLNVLADETTLYTEKESIFLEINIQLNEVVLRLEKRLYRIQGSLVHKAAVLLS